MALSILLTLVVCIAASPLSRVACAFKWAQSAHHIHIFAKYAHKIDAPSPNDVREENTEVSDRSINFNATNNIKAFSFNVELFGNISPNESTYVLKCNMHKAGRLIVHFQVPV